jgi:hypothetical protein
MINNRDNTDDFLKGFIQKSGLESPSDGFTSRVIRKIENEVAEQPLQMNIYRKLRSWYIVIFSGIAAVAYTVYYFIHSNLQFISGDYDPMIIPVFKKLFLSFKELLPGLKVSSFTVVIILAITGLFLIDRLINKFRTRKNILFSL